MTETFNHPSGVGDAGAKIAAGTRIWHLCHVPALGDVRISRPEAVVEFFEAR